MWPKSSPNGRTQRQGILRQIDFLKAFLANFEATEEAITEPYDTECSLLGLANEMAPPLEPPKPKSRPRSKYFLKPDPPETLRRLGVEAPETLIPPGSLALSPATVPAGRYAYYLSTEVRLTPVVQAVNSLRCRLTELEKAAESWDPERQRQSRINQVAEEGRRLIERFGGGGG